MCAGFVVLLGAKRLSQFWLALPGLLRWAWGHALPVCALCSGFPSGGGASTTRASRACFLGKLLLELSTQSLSNGRCFCGELFMAQGCHCCCVLSRPMETDALTPPGPGTATSHTPGKGCQSMCSGASGTNVPLPTSTRGLSTGLDTEQVAGTVLDRLLSEGLGGWQVEPAVRQAGRQRRQRGLQSAASAAFISKDLQPQEVCKMVLTFTLSLLQGYC